MRSSLFHYMFSSFIGLQAVSGLILPALHPPPGEVSEDILVALADPTEPETGTAYFEQYIDHGRRELGKFNQTYWHNSAIYKGPGSPIVLFTPGEIPATDYLSYLTDQNIPGLIAKEVGRAVLLIEHRFWGNSTPYEVQSTKNLKFLGLDQAISDFVRFARAVELPFNTNGSSNAREAPRIWTGGFYPGALGAWIESIAPGTFWATHSSGGPVEVIYDYWQYFYAIQQGMPKNCSKDFAAIVDHIDMVFTKGSHKEQADLKQLFGLQDLEPVDDVAARVTHGHVFLDSIALTRIAGAICTPLQATQFYQT